MKATIPNPLDFLRRSPTGAKIAAEVDAADAALEKRKAASATVADCNRKLDAAHAAVQKAMADERAKVDAAQKAFDAAVSDARRATAVARSKVHSLTHERSRAEQHLAATASPKVAEFKADLWQRFQSRRGSLPSLSEEVPTNQKNAVTGQRIYRLRNNVAALNRYVATVTSAMSKAEALKLEVLADEQLDARLAEIRAEVDEAEAATKEMADAGELPGDSLNAAMLAAEPVDREPKRGILQKRYQPYQEPDYAV